MFIVTQNGLMEMPLEFKKIAYLALIVSALFGSNLQSFAQQTIINVPSSDILPKGDFILKESNYVYPNEYVRITPSVIFGAGKGFEFSGGVGSTLDNNHSVKLDLSGKKVFMLPHNFRLTAGARISPYLNKGSEPDTFLYSHISHRIKKTKTTLTAGVYTSSKSECLPSHTGALLGIDQVIIPNKLRIVADYMSREDSYGAFAAGLKYRPVPTLSITTAVVVIPEDNNRVAFNVSVSKFFSIKALKEKFKEDKNEKI